MRSFSRLSAATAFTALACTLAGAQTSTETDRALVHRNAPAVAAYSDAIAAHLHVPQGFQVSVFASGLKQPRMMEVGDDGTVYVTRRGTDDVLALKDTNGDGRADDIRTFATGLTGVHGISRHDGNLYLASQTTVWRTPMATTAVPTVVVSGLPDGGQHPNRMVRFGPDGSMYVSVGSSCNDCAEDNQLERATLIRYTPDGQQREVIANGLRNTIGYDWHPATQALWGMDQNMDFRGDRLPPEELNQIKPGLNYGWPICYAQRVVDPMTNATPDRMALKPGQSKPSMTPMTREQYCAETEPSVLLMPAHSAPMAMRFYAGSQFPQRYRNDAFIALRGSWGRSDPVGYKVVRLRFSSSGEPLGFEDFVTGFYSDTDNLIYGRPVGIAIAADGALLVSDDTNGAIYRVAFTGTR